MPTIAFIHEKFPFGGGEVVTANVMQSLKKYGYRFVVFSPEFYLEKLSSPIEEVEYVTLQYKVGDSRNLPMLISEIESKKVDVFVTQGFRIPYLNEIRTLSKAKVVFVSHNAPFWESVFKQENGKHSASKSFMKWVEWYLLRSLKFKLGLFDKKLKNSYLNTYNSVDAFGVLCDSYSQEFAEKLGIDNTSSKFVTLTNAAYPKTTNGDVNKRKEVCFVGRLSYADKRVDRLLQAWRLLQDKHKDWVLNIVGDGQEMNSLKRLADELGLKRVCFKGFTTTPEIYYNSASIVCLTSTTEGWPMTLIEAQANGCATIAFDCSAGVREILSPSWENGVLIKSFDIETYADALSQLMSDDELRNKMAENGRKHVSTFSEERTAKQWMDMINNLLQ
ncbi:MAG: glycosyltransferase [Muribaculaceae bacterium]|nr:glycosyltransferase [Muribaculaceae bacterium]